jgi:hypothetical protein
MHRTNEACGFPTRVRKFSLSTQLIDSVPNTRCVYL